MKTINRVAYTEILERLESRFNGAEVIGLAEASRLLDCRPDVLKNEEKLQMFKVGGRYKIPITSLARFMTGGE